MKALVLLIMALFLLACGPTPPTLKTVPVATRLVETIEAEGSTGHTVILYGKVIDAESRQEIRLLVQGLTKADLIGELGPLIALPAYQLALPFSQSTWRQIMLCHDLTGKTL